VREYAPMRHGAALRAAANERKHRCLITHS
jgi:hypothetical protein